MSERQRGWNNHEAAILLEGLLEIINDGVSRRDVVRRVSRDLREMARQQGEDIDDIFRNENGISFQLQSMESAYKGYTISKPATRLFLSIVEMYRQNRPEYDRLLGEARAMINNTQSCESDFMTWLSTKVSPAQLSELYWCYTEIESAGLRVNLLKKPLFETTDYETIQAVQKYMEQNKYFHATHRRQFTKLIIAGRYYLTYTKEMNKKTPDTGRSVSEPPRKFDGMVTINDLVDLDSFNRTKEKDVLNKNEMVPKRAESPLVRTSADEIIVHDDETQKESKDSVDETIEQIKWIIDFNNLGNFAHTKPCFFTYFEESKGACSSWTELYVSFFAVLYEDYPHIFRPGMSFSMNKGRIELARKYEAGLMVAPKEVPGTDFVIETNISATDIVRKMKYLLDLCSVDYENVVIKYCRRTPASRETDAVMVQPIQSEQESTVIDRRSFYQYLVKTQNLSPATGRSYSSAIGSCETFAREHHYESWRLYTSDLTEAKATVDALFHDDDFIEYNDRWHNQLRAAITKLLVFITDGSENMEIDAMASGTAPQTPSRNMSYRNGPYEKILREKFRRGFRLNSPIELRKFKKYYADMHGVDVKEDDDEIGGIIQRLCILCNDRAFLPEVMLSSELKEKLLQYIDDSFENGAKMVYYQALCEVFAEDFLEYPLYNDSEALKKYLSSVANGKFYIHRDGISKERYALEDPITEIRICLQNNGHPMSNEEIYAELPHLPQEKIKQVLGSNQEFIRDRKGVYFHESVLNLSDGELEDIAQIIEQIIEEKDFVAGNELYMAIQKKYPDIIDNNSAFSELGFRDALKYKLRSRYVFTGNIISSKYKPLAMSDVFGDYARNHESFTYSELELLASEVHSTVYLDAVYKNSLRVSQNQFVSKEQGRFNVMETDAALDRICTGDYIAVQKVDNYGTFPYAGFPWNCFLLESYVLGYSDKYILLQASHAKTKCAGTIVKKAARINDFDDFIERILSESDVELKKDSVLQFLVDEGYLAARSYSRIENLIIRAQAQRNRKETD